MVTRVATLAFEGVETRPIEIQVHIAGGLVAFTIVGLADKAVGESRERVRTALAAFGVAVASTRALALVPALLTTVNPNCVVEGTPACPAVGVNSKASSSIVRADAVPLRV